MPHVNVTINGRQYRMACDDGQESHLMQLADGLEQRIQQLRGSFGEIGDARLTVMAALSVADELFEAGRRIERLEQELAGMQETGVSAAERSKVTQATVAAAFNAAAERIENLARKLNQGRSEGIPMG
jgi:cell division protein ZapA